ncbi:MAG: hypothetical protein IKU24_02925 [Clostridia bacterium]|nr:hypothetical protein [Clostridia bacterium]
MKHSLKKEKGSLPFSYIDAFFILLVGLIISFGIYFVTEQNKEKDVGLYRVEMNAYVDKALTESIPETGEKIYENGKEVGEVLFVEKKESENTILVKVVSRWKGKVPDQGEVKTVETPGRICPMWVYFVEPMENSVKGGDFS